MHDEVIEIEQAPATLRGAVEKKLADLNRPEMRLLLVEKRVTLDRNLTSYRAFMCDQLRGYHLHVYDVEDYPVVEESMSFVLMKRLLELSKK